MRIAFAVAAVLSAVSSVAAQAALVVNTPTSLVVCQPTAITYSGGTAPYFLSILPGGQTTAAALVSFPASATVTAGSYTWLVNLPAGTAVTIAVKDSTGVSQYTSILTILAGTDTSCLTSGSGSASSTSGAASTTSSSSAAATTTSAAATTTTSAAATTTSAAATTTTSAAPTTTSAPASSSAAPTTSAPATTSSSSAGSISQAVNVLALIGAAALALVA